jgi:hypothetical protein
MPVFGGRTAAGANRGPAAESKGFIDEDASPERQAWAPPPARGGRDIVALFGLVVHG